MKKKNKSWATEQVDKRDKYLVANREKKAGVCIVCIYGK